MKIGILLIATDKYVKYLQSFINSADNFLLPNSDVEYIVFTNKLDININSKRKINLFYTEHKPWPLVTLLRYHIFLSQKQYLESFDYLYFCDVDMIFINDVNESDILGDLVATIAGYFPSEGEPEINPISTAFIGQYEELIYFMGGFNGGSSSQFLKLSEKISDNISNDLRKNYIAIWHDESHLNRYFIDNKPTKIINPPFCIGERPGYLNCRIFFRYQGTKLVALLK